MARISTTESCAVGVDDCNDTSFFAIDPVWIGMGVAVVVVVVVVAIVLSLVYRR